MAAKRKDDAPSTELDPEIASLPFEEALHALEEIISRIEQGEIGLEASIAAYQRGDQLIKRCKAVLGDAEQRVKSLRIDEIHSEEAPPEG
ncbi:MAG: exodeoxyribonuclease VII small subunit [Phycisphaerales bacterium]|nr:exodeoxyribonuclease VII small subunit [Phycisphaerales bacterium]